MVGFRRSSPALTARRPRGRHRRSRPDSFATCPTLRAMRQPCRRPRLPATRLIGGTYAASQACTTGAVNVRPQAGGSTGTGRTLNGWTALNDARPLPSIPGAGPQAVDPQRAARPQRATISTRSTARSPRLRGGALPWPTTSTGSTNSAGRWNGPFNTSVPQRESSTRGHRAVRATSRRFSRPTRGLRGTGSRSCGKTPWPTGGSYPAADQCQCQNRVPPRSAVRSSTLVSLAGRGPHLGWLVVTWRRVWRAPRTPSSRG